MPKGKKKYKSGGLLRHKQDPCFASEEESIADNSSVVSNLSELRIDSDDDTLIEAEDDVVTFDDFEDKLKDAIEGTLQKNTKTRVTSLDVIIKSLSSKYMCDFVLDRKFTLCDVVERSLKRGKGEEQIVGAVAGALICTQLGSLEGASEAIFQTLKPILLALLLDAAVAPAVRAQCASTLGLCCFIASTNSEEDIEATMQTLYSVFSASLLKGNGVVPTHRPEISSLHSSALVAWSLLLTLLSQPYIMNLVNSHLRKLPQLLESTDVDLRIAAGETLAIFYEMAREYREDFDGYDIDSLCEKLHLLATDSQKFRAKKDRRQQRSSFRDILGAIEVREQLNIHIKFGDEALLINNWCQKRQYDAFCQVLGSGMNLHLKQNEMLRSIFGLGAPLIDEKPTVRSSKLQRHSAHLAADKERTKERGKLRDKRADIIC